MEGGYVANIVNLDRVSKGYGAAGPLLTEVSLGLDDATGSASSGSTAPASPPCCGC